MKFKLVMIIGILLLAQFVPNTPHFLYAATTPPIELKGEEGTSPSVGDSFQLTIERNQQEVTESIVSLSPNAIFDITSIKKMNSEITDLNVEANKLTIKWGPEEESIIKVDVVIEDEGNIEVTSSNLVAEEIIESDPVNITLETIGEESVEEVDGDELTEETEEEFMPEEESEPDVELEVESDEPKSHLEEDINKDTIEDRAEIITDSIEEEDDSEVGESSPGVETSIEPQTDEGNRYVSSWKELRDAMDDTRVYKIRIEKNFSAGSAISVNGDKLIEGNGKKINFYGYKVKIGEYKLSVENLTIEAIHGNFPSSSTFTSNSPDAVLNLKDTSFDKVQHAQVAKLEKGHIKVSGAVHFETSGPMEVFEAKEITFEENSKFTGITTGTGLATKKEVINLYNSPTITVGKNASVRLETKGEKSIINVADGSLATINVLEGGNLQVHAAHEKTSSGGALINLPASGSEIKLAQGSTLDILNHREGSGIGALLHVNGSLIMKEYVSKVAFWDKDGNANNPFGDEYRYFSEIHDGKLTLVNDYITASSATEESTLSISDDPAKSGRTFEEIFTNRNTSEIKRLLISPVEKETTLELLVPKKLNFETTKIGSEEVTIPITDLDWSMKVKDTRGPESKWQVRAKAASPLETRRGHKLDEDALIFKQGDKVESLKETVLIREGDEAETTIEWGEGEGIFVHVDPMQTEIRSDTEYSTNIIWEIIDAP